MSKNYDGSSAEQLPPNAKEYSTACDWTKNWRNRKSIQQINGFVIPMQDIFEAMGETGAVDIRGYLGIDDKGENHLLIVGIDENGNDMVDETQGQYVYDFTKPCPQQCGNKNQLNGGA